MTNEPSFQNDAPGQESIADIMQEIEAESEKLEFEDDLGSGAGEPLPEPDHELGDLVAGLVMAGGNIICERAGVKPISFEEAQAVGQSAANVGRFYNIETDPKTMAWVALIGSMVAVGLPRAIEFQNKPKTLPAEKPASESKLKSGSGPVSYFGD